MLLDRFFHTVTEENYVEKVNHVLEKGYVTDDIKDIYGKTLLLKYSEIGNVNIVKFLIEKGADINLTNNYGKFPLFMASRKGCVEVTRVLVENGAEVNKLDSETDASSLYTAVFYRHIEVVKILLNNGANIHSQSSPGWTPLHWACIIGDVEMVEYLLSKGADVNKTGKHVGTPLYEMSCNGTPPNIDVMELLMRKDANCGKFTDKLDENRKELLEEVMMKVANDKIKYITPENC